jgi:K+-transporting ATPase KdpF subunit
MSAAEIIALVVSALLGLYLIYAIFRGEEL